MIFKFFDSDVTTDYDFKKLFFMTELITCNLFYLCLQCRALQTLIKQTDKLFENVLLLYAINI